MNNEKDSFAPINESSVQYSQNHIPLQIQNLSKGKKKNSGKNDDLFVKDKDNNTKRKDKVKESEKFYLLMCVYNYFQ
jgi:hypothetical protein